jgi:hypothetical protein
MTSLHRESAERGGASFRVVDWYLGLSFGQKIVVGVAPKVVASSFFLDAFGSSYSIHPTSRKERPGRKMLRPSR